MTIAYSSSTLAPIDWSDTSNSELKFNELRYTHKFNKSELTLPVFRVETDECGNVTGYSFNYGGKLQELVSPCCTLAQSASATISGFVPYWSVGFLPSGGIVPGAATSEDIVDFIQSRYNLIFQPYVVTLFNLAIVQAASDYALSGLPPIQVASSEKPLPGLDAAPPLVTVPRGNNIINLDTQSSKSAAIREVVLSTCGVKEAFQVSQSITINQKVDCSASVRSSGMSIKAVNSNILTSQCWTFGNAEPVQDDVSPDITLVTHALSVLGIDFEADSVWAGNIPKFNLFIKPSFTN